MFNLYPMPITPDRALDPPDAIVRQDHDWACVFRCWIGDGEQQVKVICTVTRADEIDPGSIEVYLEPKSTGCRHDINITKIINDAIRKEITSHFDRNFYEIHYSNHQ
jgi:hypothetical protein